MVERLMPGETQMTPFKPRLLGNTGLSVGPLGLGAAYGAPASAWEEAFDKGCNYFYWGAVRRGGMRRALVNLMGQGKRDQMVVAVQSMSRWPFHLERALKKAIRRLPTDHVDVLLLGWHNQHPSDGIIERAIRLKEKGLCRFIGLTGHNRQLFPELANKGEVDVFHVRYNAAHRGAETEVFPSLPQESRPGVVAFTALCWKHLLNEKKMPPGYPTPSPADCYRFCLSHPSVDVCVTGPKNIYQMRQALKALDGGPLSQEEMDRMIKIGDYLHGRHGRFF